MVQLVNLPLQCIIYLLVTKGRYERVARFRVARDDTSVSSRVIIACVIDILGIFELISGYGLLVQIEQHIVIIIQGLRMFIHIPLGFAEILYSSITFIYNSIQFLLGIGIF